MTSESKTPILFKCTIPGRAAVKKNSRIFKRSKYGAGGYTIASSDYEAWAGSASWHIRKAMRGMVPIMIPVNAKMVFYFADHKEPDLSNAYQGVEDLLQELGVIENDKLIRSHDGSRKRFEKNERIEVEITRFID